jgi:protease-4
LLVVMVVLGIGLLVAVGSMGGGGGGLQATRSPIVLISVDGMIVAGRSEAGLLTGGARGSDDVVDEIERAVKDGDVKAILLRVNSPGGSAAGSQEIYDALQAARGSGKKVVVSMADVAASGGYYVSAPADRIYADAATLTGSIGVILVHQDLSGLFGKIGVRSETLKSGRMKDMLSPMGPLREDAKQVMQVYIMQVYDQFVQAVARGRRMKVEAVRALADGRIYTGEQAVKNGLVDELGGLREALAGAAKLSGVKGRPTYMTYGAPSLLKLLLGSRAGARTRPVQATTAPGQPGGLLYDEFAARLAWGMPAP